MSNITQHEAAELWEMSRDHMNMGIRLQWLAQSVQDPQLKSTLQRHVQHFQQAAQTLQSMMGESRGHQHSPGQYQSFHNHGHNQYSSGQSTYTTGQSFYGSHSQQSSVQPFDAVVVMGCLNDCKAMAVKCVWSATESSNPARQYLYQLAGDHLRMAEEHYHWLEQRGLYASPKADQQVIHQYTHTLNHIAGAGSQIMQGLGQYQTQGAGTGMHQPTYGTY
ncbi:MAG TPA: spore coat protein [Sphingobacteriaceae bacterium]|nr:spore coat protein [Sphingobacteriaceae bacterium]